MSSTHNLIFLGWGMDPNSIPPYLQMDNATYFYNYAEPIDFTPNPNVQYHVFAWSFGVYIAPILIAQWGITSQVSHASAINGTCCPIDDSYGIPPTIAQGTLDNLSEASRQKFNMRMFTSRAEYNEYLQYSSKRDLESLKTELAFFINRAKNEVVEGNIYNVAIVGLQDRIFPPSNQLAYWNSQSVPVIQLDMGHWPIKPEK
ncbi:MAG: DUF452 family protein [Bacteroidia bacterium]|nr:DUF452 family protein [Bacteroidia bacterium]